MYAKMPVKQILFLFRKLLPVILFPVMHTRTQTHCPKPLANNNALWAHNIIQYFNDISLSYRHIFNNNYPKKH